MKFCKECGKELKEGAVFCGECGTPISGSNQPTSNQPPQPVQNNVPPQGKMENPFKNMTKKTKRILIASAAAVVVLFGAYKVGDSLTSKEHLINKFETALQDHDAKAVAKILSSTDKKLKIDEASVKGFIAYFKENPDAEANLIREIKEQSKALDQLDKLDKKDQKKLDELGLDGMFDELAYNKNGFVNLEQDGKILFYDKYELNVEPVYLSIYTNYKDTEILMNGKKLVKANKPDFTKTFGPFVPGKFDFEGKLKTDFVKLNNKYSDVFAGSTSKQDVEIYLEGEDVEVGIPEYAVAGATSAKLFVNGKDTGLNLKENNRFGPVKTDGSMTVQAQLTLPWGEVKSDEVEIDDNYISLDFDGEGVDVDLPYNIPEDFTAKLFVDGKDTGINLAENSYFGPISLDGSHKMSTEIAFPWGTVKTTEIPIDDNYLDLNLTSEDLNTTLMDLSIKAAVEGLTIHELGNTSKLTLYSQNMIDDYNEGIENYKESNQGFAGAYLETDFYKDYTRLEYDGEKWTAKILVNEKYNSDVYSSGEEAQLETSDNYQTQKFVYNEDSKTWIIDEINNSSSYSASNYGEPIVKKVEKPKTITSSWLKPAKVVASK